MKIGIIAGSFKPYHTGHDRLIRFASSNADVLYVFVSLSDRENVSRTAMEEIWRTMIEPSLPGNVYVTYGGSPIGKTWELLGQANERISPHHFTVYTDVADSAANFSSRSLQKYAGDLLTRGLLTVSPVSRIVTFDTSGSEMRRFLSTGDKRSFIDRLPTEIDREAYWTRLFNDSLLGSYVQLSDKKKHSKR